MQKLAKSLGILLVLTALSGCGNKAVPQTPPPIKIPGETAPQKQPSTTNQATQTQTVPSDIPVIKSSDPNIQELNTLANDVDSLNGSAQGLNENQDLSTE